MNNEQSADELYQLLESATTYGQSVLDRMHELENAIREFLESGDYSMLYDAMPNYEL